MPLRLSKLQVALRSLRLSAAAGRSRYSRRYWPGLSGWHAGVSPASRRSYQLYEKLARESQSCHRFGGQYRYADGTVTVQPDRRRVYFNVHRDQGRHHRAHSGWARTAVGHARSERHLRHRWRNGRRSGQDGHCGSGSPSRRFKTDFKLRTQRRPPERPKLKALAPAFIECQPTDRRCGHHGRRHHHMPGPPGCGCSQHRDLTNRHSNIYGNIMYMIISGLGALRRPPSCSSSAHGRPDLAGHSRVSQTMTPVRLEFRLGSRVRVTLCSCIRQVPRALRGWATVCSVFLKIQEKTLAESFEVSQLPCPEPSSPKSRSILMQPHGNSTGH